MTGNRRCMAAVLCLAITVSSVGEEFWRNSASNRDSERAASTTIFVPLVTAEATYAIRRIEAKFGKMRRISANVDEATNSIVIRGDISEADVLRSRLMQFDRDMPENGVVVYEFGSCESASLWAAVVQAATWFPPLSDDDLLRITVDLKSNMVLLHSRKSSARFVWAMAKALRVS